MYLANPKHRPIRPPHRRRVPPTTPRPNRRDATAGEPLEFGATARVEKRRPDTRALGADEVRALPGAFGDPFRSLDTLPGVTPYLSGLPYVYVRGAPPAGTLFLYDDMALPTLFHLGLGPAVIHPAMIGPIEFFSGVGPARYGRRTGGLFASAYRDIDPERGNAFGEVELRAIDVMAMAHGPVLEGDITAAGRYGYPGLVLSLLSPDISWPTGTIRYDSIKPSKQTPRCRSSGLAPMIR